MGEASESKRGDLIRNTVVFQLKLMVDGLRDLVLLPISLIASLVGFLRGGDEPDREFKQVINLGRESERWIDLFGNHNTADSAHAVTSMDALFLKVEETLKQQYKTVPISDHARNEIDEALKLVQDKMNKTPKLNEEAEA